MYEYACHEGNYALGNILRGARLREAEATKKTQGGGAKALSRPGRSGAATPGFSVVAGTKTPNRSLAAGTQ